MARDGGRSHPGQISLVKQANEMMIEIHFVDALGHLVESHHLANKGPSNKAFSALPFDVSTVAHPPCFPRTRIFHVWQLLRQRPIARPIHLRGHALAQGFVRTLVIVTADPGSNASFLCRYAGCGWSGYIGFEHPMHLFVRTVVLWVSWPDKLHRNAQAQPPHAQARQAQSTFATKGRAVVYPNHFGQAVTTKNLRKNSAHSGIALIGQERHPKHIATEKIAHCQRLAAPPIARAKPAFEVDCPHLVAAFYCVYSPPRQHRSAPRPALALLHQMQLHQPARQGAHRRNAPGLRESSSEQPSQLFCSPTRMLLAQFAQPHSPNKMVHFPSVARQARRIPQSFQSSGSITLPPLVTALATDSKTTTHRRERLALILERKNKLSPHFQHRKLFPRHRCPKKCHLCHEPKLLPMS